MPRAADHNARRLQIAEALWSIAATKGLEEVSMRQVAAAAGISTRLVQYYFGNRDRLLTEALALRNEHDRERIKQQIPAGASIQETIRVLLLGLMPLDEESRMSSLIQLAYGVRAVSDAALLAHFKSASGPGPDEFVSQLLVSAQRQGGLTKGLDLPREARTLVALAGGMTYDLLVGLISADEAVGLVDYNVDRLFRRQSP